MLGRLLWNDIRNHKLLSFSTVIFTAASSLLIALATEWQVVVDGFCIYWTEQFKGN